MDNKFQPAGLELQILNVLWNNGPSNVRAVLGMLADGKKRAYTTVLSTMQVMERKGLLARDGMVSGAIVYRAAVAREQVMKPALRDMIANIFGGKPSAVMQHLLEDSMVDKDELAEIRRLLDEHAGQDKPAPQRGTKGRGKS